MFENVTALRKVYGTGRGRPRMPWRVGCVILLRSRDTAARSDSNKPTAGFPRRRTTLRRFLIGREWLIDFTTHSNTPPNKSRAERYNLTSLVTVRLIAYLSFGGAFVLPLNMGRRMFCWKEVLTWTVIEPFS